MITREHLLRIGRGLVAGGLIVVFGLALVHWLEPAPQWSRVDVLDAGGRLLESHDVDGRITLTADGYEQTNGLSRTRVKCPAGARVVVHRIR
jgi:hypothetical protein